MVLWLWRRPAAVAPIGPLAWELPQAVGAALKKKKKKKKKKLKKTPTHHLPSNGKNKFSWSHLVLAAMLETSLITGSENWDISGRHLAMHAGRLKIVHIL